MLRHGAPISSRVVKGGVRPHVKFRWGTWDFSQVATEESDLPSSCEGKLGVPFKSLQENQYLS